MNDVECTDLRFELVFSYLSAILIENGVFQRRIRLAETGALDLYFPLKTSAENILLASSVLLLTLNRL